MSNVMEWDELDLLRASVQELYENRQDKKYVSRWLDYMDFVLCYIFLYGWNEAEEVIGIVPFEDGLDDRCVNLVIDGKTFRDRVIEQLDGGSTDGILRIIDTEAHRDYNTAVYEAGTKSSRRGIRKRWNTMLDDRVRDAHSYLEGVVVGLDDYFYTYTGDSTLFPGGFGVPELDINCRCFVTLTA